MTPAPISAAASTVLNIMRRRPLEWWRSAGQDSIWSDVALPPATAMYLVRAGLLELRQRGFVEERWAPEAGETTEEAHRVMQTYQEAETAARAALRWWHVHLQLKMRLTQAPEP